MQRGFSLLEILVVLFVIMVIASMVTLNINSGAQDIEFEARVRALANISSYALDEAQMKGVDMGLLLQHLDVDGEPVYRYSWRERRQQGWREPELETEFFSGADFPPGIELALVLEDLPVPELAIDPELANPAPQVIFYSSGETTPGYIELRQTDSGDILWLVQWDLLGRFELLPQGQPVDEDFERNE